MQSFPKTSIFKRKLPNLCTKPILSSFVKARNLSFVKLSITMLVLVENSALRSLSSNSAIILYKRFENYRVPYHPRKSGLLRFDKSRLPSMWKTGHLGQNSTEFYPGPRPESRRRSSCISRTILNHLQRTPVCRKTLPLSSFHSMMRMESDLAMQS